MARLPRFVLPGQPQHVIQRGNNRQDIFRKSDDYQFYLEKLTDAAKKHQCDIHAYVLMTNHVHLVVTPHTEDGISKMMQMLGRYYVQYFNRCYQRTGTLWEGRYKATLIDTEQYLLTCMRYVELNPVRATGLAKHPSDYPWSSYACNALGEYNELVTAQREYKKLGKTSELRQSAYRQLFRAKIPESALVFIRESTNKAWVLGSDRFKKRIEKKLNRSVISNGHGGDRKSENYLKQRCP
ncbi:Transposase and inactivated derivatives [hydrothermal vent metagenome]|uniref:Transposase and inactivated derivatives n=1 Tax=hydrothermal vent metagenome TaxID=652676 RepID=A0A3B0Y4W1_9ZZZZ